MNDLASIQQFFSSSGIAVAGASRDKNKFGHQVYKDLKSKGLKLYPVNPNGGEICGDKVYESVEALPDGVDSLLVITRPDATKEIVENSIKKGINNIWVQQESDNNEVKELLSASKGLNYIINRCIYMYAQPVEGFHKFHRFLCKITGSYAQ
ncbi:MAG: CoA-binding protein [Bacteroidales bacterium]|nr:CoA-binding protein [Bacteroidales bacterium]